LGALLTVIVFVAVLGLAGYSLMSRTADFAANWPKYQTVIRQTTSKVEMQINGIERTVAPNAPQAQSQVPSGLLHTLILRGIGPLYALVLEMTFVPFLVFFMLAEKQKVWHGTLELFPVSRRTQVRATLEDLRDVLRSYLAGMTLLTLIVMAASSAFFWFYGFDYPILTGIVSGLLNMVPYIGVVLAWLPAFLIALTKFRTIGSLVLIAGVITGIHVLAQNLVAPQLVGKRVRLNAVAITVSLLFWGWVWGAMGLLLAIPITAALRVVCDHTDAWKPVGRWLSA
jgi:predicted PurR-regulated permease PerM